MNQRQISRLGRGALLVLLAATAVPPGRAQEARKPAGDRASGGILQRILFNHYQSPSVLSFDLSAAESLDSMIVDGRMRLTEEDAVRLALENNVDINVERFNPYFSLWGVERGRAVLDPSLQFNVNLDRLKTPTSSALQGGETLLNLNTLYDLSFRKPFEPGLDLELTFNTRRARTSSFFTSLNPSLTTGWGISLTQHLLKDSGRISRARFVRVASHNHDISREIFASRLIQIVSTVLDSYWDLVFIDEDIREKEATRDLAQMVLDQNRIQAEVGTMSPLDVIQAEAEVAARNQQLVVARYTRQMAEEQLKKLISSRPDPGSITATVEPVTKPEAPVPPGTRVEEAIDRAMEIRPEVRQAFSELENKKVQVDYTRNQLKPTLDLVASYSQNGLGGTRIERDFSQGFIGAPIIDVVPGGFRDSLDSLFSQKFIGYTIGFNFRVPIGNDDARATSAQAQIDYRQGQERLRALRQQIALEVRQAYERYEMNRASVAAADVTVRYMQQRLQGEQDKYHLGATTTRSVFEAQRDLQAALRSRLQAQIDLIKSRVAMDRAVGDTLTVYGIEVDQAMQGSR